MEQRLRRSAMTAFFVNDPARAWYEVKELSQIDRDMNGVIDYHELLDLRQKKVRLSTSGKLMELFTTHPNMLKRINPLEFLFASQARSAVGQLVEGGGHVVGHDPQPVAAQVGIVLACPGAVEHTEPQSAMEIEKKDMCTWKRDMQHRTSTCRLLL